jgi:hypothetical protein
LTVVVGEVTRQLSGLLGVPMQRLGLGLIRAAARASKVTDAKPQLGCTAACERVRVVDSRHQTSLGETEIAFLRVAMTDTRSATLLNGIVDSIVIAGDCSIRGRPADFVRWCTER